MVNFRQIEKKWQASWEKEKIFQADTGKQKKFFVTFPYPYVNGAPHVGHSYSSFRTDCYARFKRMQGLNVLYPQGFHATGEPIVGTMERLNKNDPVQINTFREFGASDKDIERFRKDVKYVVDFWIRRWIEDLKLAGFSIDWRRTFVTTTLTPTYSRFIEWQYNTLKKKGYVVQGTHPVIWCPHDQSPTGDHDRLEGEGESPVEYIILKFKLGDLILPAATLRPETIYGVTNMWLNPDATYVKAKVDGELWLISERAATMLSDQLKSVEIVDKIKGSDLLGKKCINPLTKKEVPILPGPFVDVDSSTGVVMSVPSHAPYDWIALKELIDAKELERYKVGEGEVKPIAVVATAGMGEHPAIDVCNRMNITSLKQSHELEKATAEVYKKEYHMGILRENCGEYAGLRVSECKDRLSVDFIERGIADALWDSAKVVCRCTTRCHVKILENQWFLKFSDEEWKGLVKKCLERMDIYPDAARANFLNTIDWLKDKACTRKGGLGTPLPWDKTWIVETLSDSTIYMAYYTIARIINEEKIVAEQLTDNVFDYIFLGIGDINKLSRESGLSVSIINSLKKEFEYFYPVDFRNSGKDLIQNHLTFFLFHHVAIWPEEFWPKSISVNGFVNVEGEKMSKSKGNIIPLRNLIDKYGSDLVRVNIVASSEGIDDADWRSEHIKSYRARIEFLFDLIQQLKKAKANESRNIDRYLLSVINKQVETVFNDYSQLRFRDGVQHALFETTNALRWYLKRCGDIKNADRNALDEALSLTVRMLTPVVPHAAEEMHAQLGNSGFAALSQWPATGKSIDEEAEISEKFIINLLNDFEEIRKIAKIKPKKLVLFVAEEWKFEVYDYVLQNKQRAVNEITKEIMSSKRYSDSTVAFIQTLYKKKGELSPAINRKRQLEMLKEARDFIEKEAGCKLDIILSEKSQDKKARQASPAKPGMLIE